MRIFGHTPRSRLAAVGALALVLFASLVPTLSAQAATVAPSATGQGCQYDDDEETISIKGCLRDLRETPPTPVTGVSVTVLDEAGEVVGEDETDETGAFDVPIPGDPVSALGKTFTVTIDESTLPEGAGLRNPEQVELSIRFTTTSDQAVSFPIGDPLAGSSGKLTQALQLTVGGLVFASLLAMAALGLSMIFGTTGLTNFSHGELITFGAIMAFAVDRLPGADRGSAGQHHGHRRRRGRVRHRRRVRAGSTTRCSGGRCAGAAPASSR